MSVLIEEKQNALERRWRKRSLWALLFLVPISLLSISYRDINELVRYRDMLPVDVAAGQTKHYGGSDWQFQGLRRVEGIRPGRLPAGSAPIIARFVVEIGDPDLQNLWLMCAIKLTDHTGRTWYPSSVPGMPSPQPGIETCSSTAFSGAQKGERRVIEQNYLVPSDVADELVPTLGMHSERPFYLRFAKP